MHKPDQENTGSWQTPTINTSEIVTTTLGGVGGVDDGLAGFDS